MPNIHIFLSLIWRKLLSLKDGGCENDILETANKLEPGIHTSHMKCKANIFPNFGKNLEYACQTFERLDLSVPFLRIR